MIPRIFIIAGSFALGAAAFADDDCTFANDAVANSNASNINDGYNIIELYSDLKNNQSTRKDRIFHRITNKNNSEGLSVEWLSTSRGVVVAVPFFKPLPPGPAGRACTSFEATSGGFVKEKESIIKFYNGAETKYSAPIYIIDNNTNVITGAMSYIFSMFRSIIGDGQETVISNADVNAIKYARTGAVVEVAYDVSTSGYNINIRTNNAPNGGVMISESVIERRLLEDQLQSQNINYEYIDISKIDTMKPYGHLFGDDITYISLVSKDLNIQLSSPKQPNFNSPIVLSGENNVPIMIARIPTIRNR